MVPAADVTTAGTESVTVWSAASGSSNPQTFTVNNLVPTTTSIAPNSATAGGAQFTLTVNGTNFIPNSVIYWGASPLATTYVSATQVTSTISAAYIATGGTITVTVQNPTPGGGTSNGQTFTINDSAPTLTSISPTSTAAGSSQFTLTVNGTNYYANSVVKWNGVALTTNYVAGSQVTASFLR